MASSPPSTFGLRHSTAFCYSPAQGQLMRKLLFLFLASASLFAQAPRNDKQAAASPMTIVLQCAKFWDGRSDALRSNVTVVVIGGRINDVENGPAFVVGPAGSEVRVSGTCMPGLVETHTHVLLQSDITSQEYDDQILKESVAYRTLRASRALRLALKCGFT